MLSFLPLLPLLTLLALLALGAPARAEQARQRYYFKHGNNLHDRGERLRPRWCKRLLNSGDATAIKLDEEGAVKERLLQRAWRKVGAPQGMPSRLESSFAARHPKDWQQEMGKCFTYAVKAPGNAKVTVRDARYGSRCFAALQHYTRATDPRLKRRWLAVAWRAAKDYWRKPGTAPGAWPEVLIGGGATVCGTLNDAPVKAYLQRAPRAIPAPLSPFPGTPTAEQERRQERPATPPSPRPTASKTATTKPTPNPLLMLNPFMAYWLGS